MASSPDHAPRPKRSGAPPRWRLALRFLRRSLKLRAPSFALALVAVAIGAGVTTTTLNLRSDLEHKMHRELRAYGPNLLITPPLSTSAPGPTTLDADWALNLDTGDHAAWVSPFLLAAGLADHEPATLIGLEFERARPLASAWRVQGDWPEPGEHACLLGAALARRLGVEPGANLRIAPRPAGSETELRVSGIVFTGEEEEDAALVPLRWLQGATGQEGRISGASVALEAGPEAVSGFARSLEVSAPFPLEARPLAQVSEAQGALLGKIQHMMTLLTVVVLVLAGMCVMATLMSIVVEREPEIGLMRSLGASDPEVLQMLLGEASLLGLIGGAAGLALGMADAHWVGRQLFGAAITPRPGVIPWVLAITLGLCWLAVVLPVRRALAVQPAQALRGD